MIKPVTTITKPNETRFTFILRTQYEWNDWVLDDTEVLCKDRLREIFDVPEEAMSLVVKLRVLYNSCTCFVPGMVRVFDVMSGKLCTYYIRLQREGWKSQYFVVHPCVYGTIIPLLREGKVFVGVSADGKPCPVRPMKDGDT